MDGLIHAALEAEVLPSLTIFRKLYLIKLLFSLYISINLLSIKQESISGNIKPS